MTNEQSALVLTKYRGDLARCLASFNDALTGLSFCWGNNGRV